MVDAEKQLRVSDLLDETNALVGVICTEHWERPLDRNDFDPRRTLIQYITALRDLAKDDYVDDNTLKPSDRVHELDDVIARRSYMAWARKEAKRLQNQGTARRREGEVSATRRDFGDLQLLLASRLIGLVNFVSERPAARTH